MYKRSLQNINEFCIFNVRLSTNKKSICIFFAESNSPVQFISICISFDPRFFPHSSTEKSSNRITNHFVSSYIFVFFYHPATTWDFSETSVMFAPQRSQHVLHLYRSKAIRSPVHYTSHIISRKTGNFSHTRNGYSRPTQRSLWPLLFTSLFLFPFHRYVGEWVFVDSRCKSTRKRGGHNN